MTALAQETPQLSPFQQRVCLVPETIDLLLPGGRGSGKTRGALWIVLRHVEKYGSRARVLIVRRSFPALQEIEQEARQLFAQVYPGVTYNAQRHIFRFPSGATVELGHLDSYGALERYHGRSATLLYVDELGQFADLALVDILRANLRGPKDIPLRMIATCNPGDRGTAAILERFILGHEPWQPFEEKETGRTWLYAPSTYRDNPFIDQDAYAAQLRAATAHDPELADAWLEGAWSTIRGAFFARVLDPARVLIDPWPLDSFHSLAPWRQFETYLRRRCGRERVPWEFWNVYLAFDFGISAPSVAYLMAEACGDLRDERGFPIRGGGALGPDGKWYPAGTLIALDECAMVAPGSLTRGLNLRVEEQAQRLKTMCAKWGMKARGAADDAIFAADGRAAGNVAGEFAAHGVNLYPAMKGSRLGGWELFRRMLADAGRPENDKPGFYISTLCEYAWRTLPSLPRDPAKPDDLDTDSPDHAADALRMGCTSAVSRRPKSYHGTLRLRS